MTVETIETTCEVCGHTATRQHPCRFERACSCWYGISCEGTGRKYRATRRLASALPMVETMIA